MLYEVHHDIKYQMTCGVENIVRISIELIIFKH